MKITIIENTTKNYNSNQYIKQERDQENHKIISDEYWWMGGFSKGLGRERDTPVCLTRLSWQDIAQ